MQSSKRRRRRGCPRHRCRPGLSNRGSTTGLLVVVCIIVLSPAPHVTRGLLTGLTVGIISSVVGDTLTDIWSGEPQPVTQLQNVSIHGGGRHQVRGAGVFTIGKSTLDGPDTLG